MSIEIRYGSLKDRHLDSAMNKLRYHSNLPFKVTYQIKTILEGFDKGAKKVAKDFVDMLKQYATLDEKGQFIRDKDKNGKDIPDSYVVAPERQEPFKEAMEAFDERVFLINRHKIALHNLEEAGLCPQELLALECMIDENELDMEGESHGKENQKEEKEIMM